jgi:hypothetical protein
VRPTRARVSPILHTLFNAARNALVFTCDFLHRILRSRIVDLPGFHANFLSLEPPKIGIVSKPAHQLRPPPFRGISMKAAKHAARCGGDDTTCKEKPRRCRAGPSHVLPYWSQRRALRFSAEVLARLETSSYSTA